MSAQNYGPLGSIFEFIHRNLDSFKIKQRVEEMGIRPYINHCARLAAATGAAAGAGRSDEEAQWVLSSAGC